MAWLNESYPYRVAISVDTTGVTGGTTNDVDVLIPPEWDHFWDLIDTNGYGIRVAEIDGRTAVANYQWSGFSKANKTGTLQIDNFNVFAGSGTIEVIWLYFGIDSGSETDGSGAFTSTTPVDGFIDLSFPGLRQVQFAPERPDSTVPITEFSKIAAESFYVWTDVTDELGIGRNASQGSQQLEEVRGFLSDVQTGGATQASMLDSTKDRVVLTEDGRTWLKAFVQAGSSGTDYTGYVKFLINHVTLDAASAPIQTESAQRYLIKVRDPDETP